MTRAESGKWKVESPDFRPDDSPVVSVNPSPETPRFPVVLGNPLPGCPRVTNPGNRVRRSEAPDHRTIRESPASRKPEPTRANGGSGLSTFRFPLSTGLLLCLATCASAVQRFPPPDFTSGYKLPVTAMPPARGEVFDYIDISVLLAALLVASYLVIWRRSRKGIAGLAIFSLVYFGFYRHGCICPIGAIQNVTLALADRSYALPMAAGVFFLLPILFALFVGRVFCAAVCPLGAAQDVVLRKPTKVPPWLAQALALLPWIYLGAAVLFAATGSAFLICQYDPFVAFFRLGGSSVMLSIGAAVLILGIFVGRPYCRFLCPYGALLRLVSPLAKWRVTITPSLCTHCRLCEESCPFGEIRLPSQPDGKRTEGKNRLSVLLVLLPVLVLAGALLGRASSTELSRVNPTVRTAQRVLMEETGKVVGTTDESKAFYKQAEPSADIYVEALSIGGKFRLGGALFGAWVGLVIGLKLIWLAVRRRRSEYEADPAGCVGCGRCYWSCPVERARRGDAEAIRLLEERA